MFSLNGSIVVSVFFKTTSETTHTQLSGKFMASFNCISKSLSDLLDVVL
jgi:ATP/ADP translocase